MQNNNPTLSRRIFLRGPGHHTRPAAARCVQRQHSGGRHGHRSICTVRGRRQWRGHGRFQPGRAREVLAQPDRAAHL